VLPIIRLPPKEELEAGFVAENLVSPPLSSGGNKYGAVDVAHSKSGSGPPGIEKL
jgi:hypothetical protein